MSSNKKIRRMMKPPIPKQEIPGQAGPPPFEARIAQIFERNLNQRLTEDLANGMMGAMLRLINEHMADLKSQVETLAVKVEEMKKNDATKPVS